MLWNIGFLICIFVNWVRQEVLLSVEKRVQIMIWTKNESKLLVHLEQTTWLADNVKMSIENYEVHFTERLNIK